LTAAGSGQVTYRTLKNGLLAATVLAMIQAGTDRVQAQEVTEETSKQVWGNFITAFPQSEKLYLEADTELAKQVSGGGDDWGYVYGTGLVEYYPDEWLDLTGEAVVGFTRQNNSEDSWETTLRLGLRVHFLRQILRSTFMERIRKERMSGNRLSVANLARFEYRNFRYSGNVPNSSDWRFRNRLESKFALNRDDLGEDGVWFLIGDIEWFVPMDDTQAPQRFATKRRVRIGLGYRQSFRWRFSVLLMADNARDTLNGDTEADARMIDFRVHYFP
jgi:hypothetical protein